MGAYGNKTVKGQCKKKYFLKSKKKNVAVYFFIGSIYLYLMSDNYNLAIGETDDYLKGASRDNFHNSIELQ